MTTKTLVLASMLAATMACGKTLTSPTSPSSDTPTAANTLRVTAAVTGDNDYQLTAVITRDDGTNVDVTTTATWESSAPDVATVSPTGFVDVLKDGVVDIRASFQQATGTVQLNAGVAQTRYSISGRVTRSYPDSGFVNGARVEVTTGPNLGVFTLSDPQGNYTLSNLISGPLDLQASAIGYSTWSQSVMLISDQSIDPVLTKTTPGVRR